MHELSIAMSIVEMAEQEAEKRGVRVTAVHLKVGALSGVVGDALVSAFELAVEGTGLTGARLVVEDVPILVHCPKCNQTQPLASIQDFCCPVCQTPTSEVVQGTDLLVTALEVED